MKRGTKKKKIQRMKRSVEKLKNPTRRQDKGEIQGRQTKDEESDSPGKVQPLSAPDYRLVRPCC